MMHGWQSNTTDGTKGGCDFLERLQWSPHPQLQDVVWCGEVQCRGTRRCSCSGLEVVAVASVVDVAVVELKLQLLYM